MALLTEHSSLILSNFMKDSLLRNFPSSLRFECLGLLLLLSPANVWAQAPLLVSRVPAANAVAAPGAAPVVLGFSALVPAGTLVHVVGDLYGGRRPGPLVLAGNTATLTPVPPFGPGELVRVSVPSTGAGPQVYEFRAAAGVAAATFGPRQTLAAVGVLPTSVAPGDFDGDGDIDLAVSNAGNGGTSGNGFVFIYRNNGLGQFTRTSQSLIAKLTQEVIATDAELDGNLDLMHVEFASPGLFVNRNDGLGNFVIGGGGPGEFDSVIAADFNGDGYPDYATTGSQNQLTVGLNNSRQPQILYTITRVTLGNFINRAAVADLDGNGTLDLAVPNGADRFPYIHLRFNNGAGQFTAQPMLTMPTSTYELVTGDFDNDGRADLLAVSGTLPNLYFCRNLGSGAFAAPVATALPTQQPANIVVADLNGDGFLDVAVTSRTTAVIQILLGNGTGVFTPTAATLTANGVATKIYAVDVNGDRRLDLVTAVTTTNSVDIFLNQAAPLATVTSTAFAGLQLYPNPTADGSFHLRLPLPAGQAALPRHAQLYNALGQVVQTIALPQGAASELATDVDVRPLPPGVYALHLTLGEARTVRQVVVK
jgi:hypothetical protein